MQAGKLSSGTHLDVLKGIGRNLLVRFLDPFQVELAANHIKLPDPSLGDTAYFQQAAAILAAPGTLPDRLTITLAAIAQMARDPSRKKVEISAAHPATGPPARYALRKGLGFPAVGSSFRGSRGVEEI